MLITPPPIIPQITDPSTFATRAQAWVVWQANELYPALEDSSTVLTLSTSSTSTTSNTIGTGSKSFTVETGKGYLAGQSLSIAYTTTPTNRMFAVVTSYNSGTGALVVDVQAVEGSGTFIAWSIALAFNGVIGTGQIANEAVTLAKLARVGTAGQFLQSKGSGASPEYVSIPPVIGTLIGYQIFTSSGTYDKTVNNPSFVIVEVQGGGGAGGTTNTNSAASGGGGGAGGYSLGEILASSLDASVSITVGGAGGTSSFGAFCSATGGAAGTGGSAAGGYVGGAGGSGSGGNLNFTGSMGASGAGGTTGCGGSGGCSKFSGNGRGGVVGAGTAGGTNSGSGGGGGQGTSGSAGSGSSGIVIVWEYA